MSGSVSAVALGILAALGVAGVIALAAPVLLGVRPWTVRWPLVALMLWLAAFGLGLLALAGSLIATLFVATAASDGTAPDAGPGVVIGLIAWLALAGTGAAVSLVLIRAEPLAEVRSATAAELELLAATATLRTTQIGGVRVAFVRSARPIACATAQGGGLIIVSTTLADALGPSALRVVLEHERAHLRQRHDLLLGIASLQRACVPRFAGALAMERSVRLLVELVADDRAARVCGPEAVRDALVAFDRIAPNECTRLRAARVTAAAERAGRAGGLLGVARPGRTGA